MKYSDRERIEKMIAAAEKLLCYLRDKHITTDDICNDYAVQWTVTTPLYHIGEQVYQLSDACKLRYPEVPWSRIAGLRHRLIHDYDGTNWVIIADTVMKDVPAF